MMEDGFHELYVVKNDLGCLGTQPKPFQPIRAALMGNLAGNAITFADEFQLFETGKLVPKDGFLRTNADSRADFRVTAMNWFAVQ